MLIFIRPSLVSTIPCKPTLLLGPPPPPLPPLLPLLLRSLLVLGGGICPQALSPLKPGLCCNTGLLCTLMPGETALRLKLDGSRSSSLPRFRLFAFLAASPAVGAMDARGVDERDRDRDSHWSCPVKMPIPELVPCEVVVESMLTSSLITEELFLGNSEGGGVLCRRSKLFQKRRPSEFFSACWLKVLVRESAIEGASFAAMSSSTAVSGPSW